MVVAGPSCLVRREAREGLLREELSRERELAVASAVAQTPAMIMLRVRVCVCVCVCVRERYELTEQGARTFSLSLSAGREDARDVRGIARGLGG